MEVVLSIKHYLIKCHTKRLEHPSNPQLSTNQALLIYLIMAPTYQGTKLPTCYASCSIGHKPEHDLPSKLEAISSAGFEAIELSMPDILSYAKKLNGSEPDPKDFDTIVKVGAEIKKLTAKYNLKILMLQPFANFEGWIKGKQDDQRKDAWERAMGWMRIMEAVGTDMLQVSSVRR